MLLQPVSKEIKVQKQDGHSHMRTHTRTQVN